MFSYHLSLNPWFLIMLTAILVIIAVIILKRYRKKAEFNLGTLDEVIKNAGYAYDSKQDIFYSVIDAWQRDLGYSRLYDEAAAPMGIIIDCEPIFFEYDNRSWMIEFWKGQYGMATGCEIGVYIKEESNLMISNIAIGDFYQCASNKDCLLMSCYLIKDGKILFERRERHWWLTGFKLGECSDPSQLTMILEITLKDERMCRGFIQGLINAGYRSHEIFVYGNTVGIQFDDPRTSQPLSRIEETDWITQKKNSLLCKKYREITGPYDNFPDKAKAIHEQAPEIYSTMINIGRAKPLLEIHKKIRGW